MKGFHKYEQIIEYARLYYEEKRTQDEIAAMFDVSRSSVSRGLKLAQSTGAVQVRVIDPFSDFSELAHTVKEKFNLEKVIIAPVIEESYEIRRREIGHAAASYFADVLEDGSTVGVTWGTTVAEMAAALSVGRQISVRFVQMLGAGGNAVAPTHINEVTRRIAEAFRSDWFMLAAPAVVDNSSIRQALMQEDLVASVLDMGRAADIALIGVGTPDHHSGAIALGYINEEEMASIKEKGAVGEICYRFFDINGNPCNTAIEERVIGISLDELGAIPTRIGIAGGDNKIAAILGALHGGYINVLITDDITARGLLERKAKPFKTALDT